MKLFASMTLHTGLVNDMSFIQSYLRNILYIANGISLGSQFGWSYSKVIRKIVTLAPIHIHLPRRPCLTTSSRVTATCTEGIWLRSTTRRSLTLCRTLPNLTPAAVTSTPLEELMKVTSKPGHFSLVSGFEVNWKKYLKLERESLL